MVANLPSGEHRPQHVSALTTVRVGHDLRTMLSVMAHCTESLRRRLADYADDRDLLELEGAIDSAFHISRELIALGRPQPAVSPPVVDVNELVEQAKGVLARVAGPTVELVYLLNASSAIVEAEAVELEWVLFDLVANSRDAMPNGGTVIVETATTEPGPGPRLRHLRLTISDTGEGVGAEMRDRMFVPFTTSRDQRFGLGLTSVAMIIRTMKGWLHVDSKGREGTRFDIYLPLLKP